MSYEELTSKTKGADTHWQGLIAPSGKAGKGLSLVFEQYVRGILATGCSAATARGTIVMSAKTFLSEDRFRQMEVKLPLERWFRAQREALGNEAWTYAMIQIAGADKILQWGFDETKLDGVSTMNQWVLLQQGNNAPEIVTMEAAGLTVGGTAPELAEHVANSWETGQRAVELVRIELGADLCDDLVPLACGGVVLHKIQGAMHDTCNTANLVPHLVLQLRETSGRLYYGEEEWEAMPAEQKPWFDYLCGNHSRNLPLDEWNREFEAYIKDELGEAIMEVQKAGGGRTRVEGSGILLLRAMCRLTHTGTWISFLTLTLFPTVSPNLTRIPPLALTVTFSLLRTQDTKNMRKVMVDVFTTTLQKSTRTLKTAVLGGQK